MGVAVTISAICSNTFLSPVVTYAMATTTCHAVCTSGKNAVLRLETEMKPNNRASLISIMTAQVSISELQLARSVFVQDTNWLRMKLAGAPDNYIPDSLLQKYL